ncbi:coiled-coil domain-containing protein 63-like [Clytia hemisphaerica]
MMNKVNSIKLEDKTADETQEELQAELIRLQRQYRLLEEDRRTYREETEYVLKKQRDSFTSLNNEHDDLKTDYKLASSRKNKSFDKENIEQLRKLLDDEEDVKVAMEAQMSFEKEINRKIKKTKQKMDAFRKDMGGCQATAIRCKTIIKQNRVMENRLNEANVKFNTALAKNKELREEINHINVQRARFTELQQKLHKHLVKGKGEKNHLIEQSTLLFNSRDEAEHRMHSLRERSERDMNTFNSELKDLLRIIDHDKKLREFMQTKMEERTEIYETAVKDRREKKLLNYVKGLQVELEHYENIFNELQKVSGTSDIDNMVEKFIRIEDQNFALFNFVKEQAQEVQAMDNNINSIREQIDSMRKEDVHLENKHKAIKKSLQDKEIRINEVRFKVNDQLKLDQKTLNGINTKIDCMLNSVRCDRSAMTELLAGSRITYENLASYLGLIEQKASELLQARALLGLRKGDDGLTKEQKLEDGQKPISFQTVGKIARYLTRMPSLSDDLPDIAGSAQTDTDLRPISQSEARALFELRNKARAEAKEAKDKLN